VSRTARLDPIVSSEEDRLILVDAQDREIGTLDKGRCHDGDGQLHRAFSVFVLDSAGRVLLQQRAEDKRLWPGYWSNSCCSHPRLGEDLAAAAHRRLAQELGIECPLQRLYAFCYQARFGEAGSEHEYCHVFIGRSDATPTANRTEVAAWRWLTAEELQGELADHPEQFTPWFRMEWAHLTAEFPAQLAPRA
jgi:isopentenyl-diphosphate delta-isomerase